jgi:hypothetical protein
MNNLILCFCVLLTVSGCGRWARHNTTDEEMAKDQQQCRYKAQQEFPVDLANYWVPPQYNCYNHHKEGKCKGGEFTPGHMAAYDKNLQVRGNSFEECMKSKKYVFCYSCQEFNKK